jgi:8-oxo-dGTP pyrophosphatase MutT (NUDIX family)
VSSAHSLSPAQVAGRLEPFPPVGRRRGRGKRRAAVAAVLRFAPAGAEVLLMERAVRSTDRWSGHVSFPGGHADAGDADLLATAIRETREEVGLSLARESLLGALPEVRAVARGKLLPMTITPLVFHLEGEPRLRLGPEAAAAFWLPLAEANSGALDATHVYRLGPVPMSFPCWNYQGHVVWGLTFQMLRTLLSRLGR